METEQKNQVEKIQDLLNKARETFNKDYAGAVSFCEEARVQAEDLKNEELLLESLGVKAHLASFSGRDEDFRQFYKELALKSKTLKNLKYQEKAHTMMGAYHWNRSRYEESLEHFQKAQALLPKINDPSAYALNKRNFGMTYSKLGENRKSITFLRSAVKWAKESGNKTMIASTCYWLGYSLAIVGKFNEALKSSFEAVTYFEEINDLGGAGMAYNSIGLVYRDVKVFRKKDTYADAIAYFAKAKECGEKSNDIRLLADVYNNIGLTYIGDKDWDKVLENYNISLKYRKMLPFKENEAITLQNIGNVFRELGDIAKAYDYYLEAINIRRELKNHYYLILGLTNFLNFLCKHKMIEEADKIYGELVSNEPHIGDNKNLLMEYYNGICFYFETKGDYRQALFYYQQSKVLEEEIIQNDLDIRLKETEKKHQEKIARLYSEKLIAQEKVKAAKAMACTTCHQISQPMTVLQGYLELLLIKHNKYLVDRQDKHYVSRIRKAVESVNNLLHSLSNNDDIKFGFYLEDTDMVITDREKDGG